MLREQITRSESLQMETVQKVRKSNEQAEKEHNLLIEKLQADLQREREMRELKQNRMQLTRRAGFKACGNRSCRHSALSSQIETVALQQCKGV